MRTETAHRIQTLRGKADSPSHQAAKRIDPRDGIFFAPRIIQRKYNIQGRISLDHLWTIYGSPMNHHRPILGVFLANRLDGSKLRLWLPVH
jgi:hypothetical protein